MSSEYNPIDFSCSKERGINHHQAIMYAVGIVTLKALSTLMLSHEFYLAFHNGMKVRLAICSLVYRKVLRVSQKALGGTSPGKVVNMMSSDARRIDSAPFSMNYLWVSPLFTLLVSLLIYYETGLIGLVGIAVILVIVPISSMINYLLEPKPCNIDFNYFP